MPQFSLHHEYITISVGQGSTRQSVMNPAFANEARHGCGPYVSSSQRGSQITDDADVEAQDEGVGIQLDDIVAEERCLLNTSLEPQKKGMHIIMMAIRCLDVHTHNIKERPVRK